MTETETNQQMEALGNIKELNEKVTRAELKSIALKERLANVVSQYEEQDADRRVEITLLTQKNEELTQRVEALETSQRETQESAKPAD